MNDLRKKRILAILAMLSFFLVIFSSPEYVRAQAGTPAQVLAEINGYRSINGLGPLSENVYLTIAAQRHAEWIVATGLGGHIGEDGSTAADRARAAGYGEGAQIWVTENWARNRLGASGVVYEVWAPSEPHRNNMLTTWHNEFGAGVALDGQGLTVYVVKFAHSGGSVVPAQPTATPGGPTLTPVPIIQPVTTAEPNPDGSVIHIVKYGQTLWAIFDAYKVTYEMTFDGFLAQNNLTEDTPIFPEEELIIVPANEEVEETPQLTLTPTVEQSTSTPTPTKTPMVESTPADSTPADDEGTNAQMGFLVNIFSGDTLWVGVGLVGVSLFGIVLLFFTSARLR